MSQPASLWRTFLRGRSVTAGRGEVAALLLPLSLSMALDWEFQAGRYRFTHPCQVVAVLVGFVKAGSPSVALDSALGFTVTVSTVRLPVGIAFPLL